MPTFTRSCHIGAAVQALYDFHLDTRNLPRVQPPGFTVVKMDLPPEPVEGARTRIVVRILGLVRQTWLIQWAEVSPPSQNGGTSARLVDEMLEGPFPAFRQEHIFQQEGEGAGLVDRVDFQPPFQPIGWLLLPVIYLQLHFMFAWRHHCTRRLLEMAGRP